MWILQRIQKRIFLFLRKTLPIFCLLAATEAQAQLKWETSSQEFTPAPEAESLPFQFTVKNTGKEPASLIAVVPNCDCTEVSFHREPIPPGKESVVEGVFTFETRSGVQRKKIQVWSNPQEGPPHELEFVVHLPEVYQVEPEGLLWSTEETDKVKSFTLRFLPNFSWEVTGVSVEPTEAFEVVDWKKSNDAYAIQVRPKGNADPGTMGDLSVQTNAPWKRLQTLRLPLIRDIPAESMPPEP